MLVVYKSIKLLIIVNGYQCCTLFFRALLNLEDPDPTLVTCSSNESVHGTQVLYASTPSVSNCTVSESNIVHSAIINTSSYLCST